MKQYEDSASQQAHEVLEAIAKADDLVALIDALDGRGRDHAV